MDDLTLRLDIRDALPGALARTAARDARALFPESTLVRLKGRREPPLFLSVLVHGNETVGWEALRRLQAWSAHHPLPRSMLIFIGNVRAAEAGLRMCPGRPDYNRIWRPGAFAEHALSARVLEAAREAAPFAAIDLHNNTGANPHYTLVHHARAADLQLASLFAPQSVLTRNPPGTLSEAFSGFCPAVTAECGQSGVDANERAAFEFVLAALHVEHWRGAPDREMALFSARGRIEIDPAAAIAFSREADGALELPPNLEKWNFFERPAGSTFARLRGPETPLRVVDEAGRDVTASCFRREDDRLVMADSLTPMMLTTSETAIRADCLGYLAERLPAGEAAA